MAAPTFVAASTGSTDATGAWSHTCMSPGAAGRLILVQIVQDGTGTVNLPNSATNITALDGTANTWTRLQTPAPSGWILGTIHAATMNIFAGRSTGTSAPTISGSTNTSGDDMYFRAYEFQDANAGSADTDVFENPAAASSYAGSSQGTSGTISDADVETTGPDRLALNFVAINDDNTITAFTGETGGDWALAVAGYIESGGTDAALYLMSAAMPSAGTIGGGTTTNPDAADSWVSGGFAIIGTTVAQDRVPRSTQMIQLLAQ